MVQNVLFGRSPLAMSFGPRESAPLPDATAAGAGAERAVSGSLSVVTKEGDTVTLSASYDASVTYAGARSGGARLGIASTQVSRSVSIEVQGDLSAKEMREIRQVVKRFMHDLREMIHGGQPSLSNVTDVHARTLASISATSDTTNTVTVAAISARPLPVPAPVVPALPQAPGDSPAQRAPLAGEDVVDPPTSPAPVLLASGVDDNAPTMPAILTRNGATARA